jgi:hypothetical protein
MKSLAKIVGISLLALALLVTAALAYSTARGYTTWWFRSDGNVAVDGVREGYLHKNWSHTAVIITRSDTKTMQSYLVRLSGSRLLIHCGDWHAPQLPVFSTGDVRFPCSVFNPEAGPQDDAPVLSTLLIRPGFVEFGTLRGKKVRATW